MEGFIIDTVGENSNPEKVHTPDPLIAQLLEEHEEDLKTENRTMGTKPKKNKSTHNTDDTVQNFFVEMGWTKSRHRKDRKGIYFGQLDDMGTSESSKEKVAELLKEKSVVLREGFEKLHSVLPVEISDRKLKEERKKQASLTKGKKWYGLPATEVTDEVKHDLEALQMRSVLDPKRFYKKNDLKVLPKYFQIGKVMDSPLDYYSNRTTKKQQKRTLVEELLADEEFNKYNKRKYKEIIEEKQKTHYKAWRQAKKLKGKRK